MPACRSWSPWRAGRSEFTLGALAALAVLMITINARMLLMSAALYPWLRASPAWKIYPTLHVLTDPSWLITMRYRAGGGSDAGVLLGSSALLAIAWIAAACVGHVGGTLIADPRRYRHRPGDADLLRRHADPALARRAPRLAWIVAGAVAVAVYQLAGGWWFIVAGAVAGSVVGGFLDDSD